MCYLQPLSLATGRQLAAARTLIGWGQIELAKKARVSIGTIRRMESFAHAIGCNANTLHKVQVTLEKAGIEFLNHGEPGVKLKKR
jgi:transcriptional regulator with XRE-family HTH domain